MKANTESKQSRVARLALWTAVAALGLIPLAQAEKKEFKYSVGAGGMVAIVNQKGAITVRPSAGRQVIISANPASAKVEVDASQTGNRVSVRTHMLGKATGDEARVDYDVQVPPDVHVSIGSGSGDVRIENLRADVTVDGEEGSVEIRGISGGIVQVQSVNAAVILSNIQKSRVQVATSGGSIQLNNVSGPSVTAKSTTGGITYAGDFAGGGNYLLTNHSGDIGVSAPVSASIDLTARSIQGSVENDFPLQKPAHAGFPLKEGKTLAGISNAGSSSVELRSFSGRIRVKKQ